jgi:prolyl-tRNA editing enzyme YbaK/EbsC (Cys-tRNA(Pro) deacylase)
MHPSVQKVQTVLRELGYQGDVVELEASTRTAVEAAQAAGCEVGQIVKSLVFLFRPDGGGADTPILMLVSGPNRVHEKHFGQLLGGTLARADADFVREVSGFSIGGIPPVGHASPLPTYIDEDLMQYPTIWAAAGTPNAIFQISPAALVKISKARLVNVK